MITAASQSRERVSAAQEEIVEQQKQSTGIGLFPGRSADHPAPRRRKPGVAASIFVPLAERISTWT